MPVTDKDTPADGPPPFYEGELMTITEDQGLWEVRVPSVPRPLITLALDESVELVRRLIYCRNVLDGPEIEDRDDPVAQAIQSSIEREIGRAWEPETEDPLR